MTQENQEWIFSTHTGYWTWEQFLPEEPLNTASIIGNPSNTTGTLPQVTVTWQHFKQANILIQTMIYRTQHTWRVMRCFFTI